MIRRYNVRAKKWIDGGLEEFRNQQFVVYMNEVHQNAESGSFESRPYYPVADKCDKKKDPADGCLYPPAQYYMANFYNPNVQQIMVTVMDKAGNSIVSKTLDVQYYKTYTASNLGCTDDYNECQSRCFDRGGVWSYNYCYVYYTISDICFRIAKNGDKWTADSPAKEKLSYTGDGCYYSNTYQAAAYTKTQTLPATIPVVVRSNLDPVIAASEFTRGCSDRYIATTKEYDCFGQSASEQNITGVILLLIGAAWYAIDVLVRAG